MKARSALILGLLLLPHGVMAEDLIAQPPQQSAAGASDLLPQTGDAYGVSSTGAGTALQPGATSLQGTVTDGGSLSAPTDQTLQASPSDESIKLFLAGEADGTPRTLDDSASHLGEDLVMLAIGLLIFCGVATVLRRRVLRTNLAV